MSNDKRHYWYELYTLALFEIAEAELVTGIKFKSDPNLYGDKSKHGSPIEQQEEDDEDYQGSLGRSFEQLEQELSELGSHELEEETINDKLRAGRQAMVAKTDSAFWGRGALEVKSQYKLYLTGVESLDDCTVMDLLKRKYPDPADASKLRNELVTNVATAYELLGLKDDQLEEAYYSLLKSRHPKYKNVWSKIQNNIQESERHSTRASRARVLLGHNNTDQEIKEHTTFVLDEEARFRAQILHEARINEQWKRDRQQSMERGLWGCKAFSLLCGIATFAYTYWLLADIAPAEIAPLMFIPAYILAYINTQVNGWVSRNAFGILFNFLYNESPHEKTPLINRVKRFFQDLWHQFPYNIYNALANKKNIYFLLSFFSGIVWGAGTYRGVNKVLIAILSDDAALFATIIAAWCGIAYGLVFTGLCFEHAAKSKWDMGKYFKKLFRVGAVANKLSYKADANNNEALRAMFLLFSSMTLLGLIGTAATGTYPLEYFFDDMLGVGGDIDFFDMDMSLAYFLSIIVSIVIGVAGAFCFYIGGAKRTVLDGARGNANQHHIELENLRKFKNDDLLGIEAAYAEVAVKQDAEKGIFARMIDYLSPFDQNFSKKSQTSRVYANGLANAPAAAVGLSGVVGNIGLSVVGGGCAAACSIAANSAGVKPDISYEAQARQACAQRKTLALACNSALVHNIELYIKKRKNEGHGVGFGAYAKDTKISAANQLIILAGLAEISTVVEDENGNFALTGKTSGQSVETTVIFSSNERKAISSGRLADHAAVVLDKFSDSTAVKTFSVPNVC